MLAPTLASTCGLLLNADYEGTTTTRLYALLHESRVHVEWARRIRSSREVRVIDSRVTYMARATWNVRLLIDEGLWLEDAAAQTSTPLEHL